MGADYIDFFLGANTSKGFLSRYEQISKNQKIKKLYVIKGGAGTGKSTIMKKVAEEYHKRGFQIERIHCSSDPDSLDGVIVEEKGMAILDGTPFVTTAESGLATAAICIGIVESFKTGEKVKLDYTV